MTATKRVKGARSNQAPDVVEELGTHQWIAEQEEGAGVHPNIPAVEINAFVIEVTELESVEWHENIIAVGGPLDDNEGQHKEREIGINLEEAMVAALVEEGEKAGDGRGRMEGGVGGVHGAWLGRGWAWWPERNTLPAENFAFVSPMTERRAMMRGNGGDFSKII